VSQDRGYTFVDYCTQGYMALVALIVLAGHGRIGRFWPVLVILHGAVIAVIDELIRWHARRPDRRVVGFLRHFYPVLLYGAFYCETGLLNHVLFAGFLDPYFIRAEGRLFGFQPSLAFMAWLPYRAVSEVFYAAYFSYYLMIGGVGLALFFRNREQFFHYLSVVSFVFYACYLTYILLPVIGPRIFFRDFTGYSLPGELQPAVAPFFPSGLQAGPFYRLMAWIYQRFEAPGAAFPSSHVAIAIATVYFSFLYLRPIRWPHFAVMVLLCAATVYGRYHYALDVAGGAATAAVLIPVGNRLYFRFKRAD
jgi:membrane-associated phospholipid phosphatase